jgi:hypothetical protein
MSLKSLFSKPDDHERISSILSRVTYKPEVEIKFENDLCMKWVTLWLVRKTVCTHTKKPADIMQTCIIDYDCQIDDVLVLLRDYIKAFEIHEMDEWLKLDGKLINDPHKEKI